MSTEERIKLENEIYELLMKLPVAKRAEAIMYIKIYLQEIYREEREEVLGHS